MSEYKTLDQWFPSGRGDGRKFLVFMSSDYIVEPVIKAIPFGYSEQVWFAVDEKGRLDSFSDFTDVKFKEYVAPNKTKKITLYRPVYRDSVDKNHYTLIGGMWHTDKKWLSKNFGNQNGVIVGFMSIDVEVDDE